jgi:TatA/E family protein of Tat protein translocase
MSGGIGLSELIIIFCIALLFFGAGRFKDIAKVLGKGLRAFTKAGQVPDKKEDDDSKSGTSAKE